MQGGCRTDLLDLLLGRLALNVVYRLLLLLLLRREQPDFLLSRSLPAGLSGVGVGMRVVGVRVGFRVRRVGMQLGFVVESVGWSALDV